MTLSWQLWKFFSFKEEVHHHPTECCTSFVAHTKRKKGGREEEETTGFLTHNFQNSPASTKYASWEILEMILQESSFLQEETNGCSDDQYHS